jgi:hypothetical protein
MPSLERTPDDVPRAVPNRADLSHQLAAGTAAHRPRLFVTRATREDQDAAAALGVALALRDRMDVVMLDDPHLAAPSATNGLLVIALGPAGGTRWASSRAHVLDIVRTARVPVLAVPATRQALPATAVVGVDFTPGSRAAAATAAKLVGADGTLLLVHVTSSIARPATLRGEWLGDDADSRLGQLHAFASSLRLPERTQVRCLVRHGRPAAELLAASLECDADLIALGTSNGMVPIADVEDPVSRIVRGATCAVLVAPPSTVA